MNAATRRRYESRAQIVKAMAHPSRLLILDMLQDKEQCVCDITRLVGADQSTVSKHLALLKAAGLIEDRKQGSSTYYRVRCRCLQGFFSCIENVLKSNLKAQQEAITAE